MTINDLKSRKIAILGMGANNQHLAAYLKDRSLDFEVIENWENPDELLGKIDRFDIAFRTPGLPYLSKPIQQALAHGVEISSQTKLFFDLCPGHIAGVTGTKGKGTTATLLFDIINAGGKKAWLAGNIGKDPFVFLDDVKTDDWVVLELSSFQLQDLHKSPGLAVVLKIIPEHLNYHKNFQEYVSAKQHIVRHQSADDIVVLNYDSEIVREFAGHTPAQVRWNSNISAVHPGSYVKDQHIVYQDDIGEAVLLRTSDVQLKGRFNLENVTAAIAAGVSAGVRDFDAIARTVKDFKGLPHRLEFVAQVNGVKYYDDSFSTTPETTAAAIGAFDEPIVLIVGGSEKGSDYRSLAKAIVDAKVAVLISIGVTGPAIAKLARTAGYQGRIVEKKLLDMEEIVKEASDAVSVGEVVLLSPASASFDMFDNYKQRGELFAKFVKKLDARQD